MFLYGVVIIISSSSLKPPKSKSESDIALSQIGKLVIFSPKIKSKTPEFTLTSLTTAGSLFKCNVISSLPSLRCKIPVK